MRKLLLLALGAPLLALSGCVHGFPQRTPWIEVRTPNFVLLSPMRMAEAAELASDLESFRSVVEIVTGRKIPPSPVPVRVYAFDSERTYRPFSLHGAAGYFASSMRASTIVVSDWRWQGFEARDVLQHEYVHFLLRNRGHHAYPPWYDEGMAEFLSTVQRRNDAVEIGRPARHRIREPRRSDWLPLEDLLGLRSFEGLSGELTASFYAEAWAFVHYLYLGREGPKKRGELTLYLKALRAGSSNEEAVVQAFGAESRVLGHQLRSYLERGHYTYFTASPERFDAGATPQVRVLSEAQVASALGELSNAIGRYEQAERHYAAALVARPGDARALAGLGTALAGQGRLEAASARFEAALAADPDDALVELDQANSLHARARAETDDAAARKRLAAQARRHYVRAWKLDDSIPETYAEYGATFLLDGEDPARGRATLEHAEKLLPASPEIKLSLARVYAKLGRREEARDLALVVSTWSHSERVEGPVQELLEATAADDRRGEPRPASGSENSRTLH